MFRTLLHALRAGSSLKGIQEVLCSMMQDTEGMYKAVTEVLLGNAPHDERKEEVYAKDKEVNRKEREIRRRLVSHLSLNLADAPTCLVFMSVAKDVERIGDYCKNIFEVSNFYSVLTSEARYAQPLQEIGRQITVLFQKGRKAFADSDEELAMEAIREQDLIAKKCDMLVTQLLNDALSPREAVSTALLSRYFKRTARHIGNVVTSVVVSVEDIDFFPKGR